MGSRAARAKLPIPPPTWTWMLPCGVPLTAELKPGFGGGRKTASARAMAELAAAAETGVPPLIEALRLPTNSGLPLVGVRKGAGRTRLDGSDGSYRQYPIAKFVSPHALR